MEGINWVEEDIDWAEDDINWEKVESPLSKRYANIFEAPPEPEFLEFAFDYKGYSCTWDGLTGTIDNGVDFFECEYQEDAETIAQSARDFIDQLCSESPSPGQLEIAFAEVIDGHS